MYEDINDQELLYLIGESSEEATDILYNKYKRIIHIKVKRFVNFGKKVGLEYNDLFQEGMVGLSEAIKAYKDQKDTKFSSFANICIDRQIFSTLAKANRKKHFFLNDSFSLDSEIDGDGRTLIDFLFDDNSDPSIEIEDRENRKILCDVIYKDLSDFEKQVFDLKIAGLEYKEISSILNKSYKSVDSALQRIRVKAKKALTGLNL